MGKPVTTISEAATASEVPPVGPSPAKAAVATEVGATAGGAAPTKARSEKALRLAKALRDNLKRRKAATRPARPSN